MTPKEEAQQLVNKYYLPIFCEQIHWKRTAKQCALIAVEEIIEEARDYCDDNYHSVRMIYWTEVKQEINKL